MTEKQIDKDGHLISYCGLYCGHCFSRTHIAPTATKLKDYMRRQGFETFGPYMPNFKEFWKFTTVLIDAEGCPGCGKNGGNPSCEIRICAREREIISCPLCEEYPCAKFSWLPASENYPMLAKDNLYLKENGLDAWIEMQINRRLQGFTYVEEREKHL
jgi:hypothetical protein